MSVLTEEPQIGTIETIKDDFGDDFSEMESHLYNPGVDYTLCGIDRRKDAHRCMHKNQNAPDEVWHYGQTACSRCGAPLCGTCYRLATNAWETNK